MLPCEFLQSVVTLTCSNLPCISRWHRPAPEKISFPRSGAPASVRAAGILLRNGGIVGRRSLKFNHVRRHFCHHVLALQDAELHVGSGCLPTEPCSLRLSAWFRSPCTGLLSCKLALVAAKALEANSNANPNTKLFDTVANFMTAPFSSPNLVGERLGRPGSRLARENLCVLPRIAYNAAVGVQQTSRKRWPRAVTGVFSPGPPNRA